jgi:septal ring factor EnvC (AmiA/AmiB activator)
MNEEKINRTELLQVRLTPKESEKINNKFSNSTSRNLSDFVRKILLDKPVTFKMRNQSLDEFMKEMVALRSELNAIGNNYNQVVKRLHSLQQIDEIKKWLLHNESTKQILLNKIDEIKQKINSISDQWLRS